MKAQACSVASQKSIRFAELCCGLGGFRLGLELEGWQGVYACDSDEVVAKAHRHVFGHCDHKDVSTLDASDLPACEVLVAGFPCQPFSSSGHRNADQHRHGNVFEAIVQLLLKTRIPVAMFENVQGLLSNQKGYTFARILEAMTGLGFRVDWVLFDALWCGVPQHRPRLLLCCYQHSAGSEPKTDLFGDAVFDHLPSGWVFGGDAALPKVTLSGVVEGARLDQTVEELRPTVGRRAAGRATPFRAAGSAIGNHYWTSDVRCEGSALSAVLGDICCPRFKERSRVRSARYWGHTGDTRIYMCEGEYSHCIGTSIGAAPLFAVPESLLASKKQQDLFEEFANWRQVKDGVRVARLVPERSVLLFGEEAIPLVKGIQSLSAGVTTQYKLIGNLVVPSVARFMAKCIQGKILGQPTRSPKAVRRSTRKTTR